MKINYKFTRFNNNQIKTSHKIFKKQKIINNSNKL